MESTPMVRMLAVAAALLVVGACARTERLPASFYDGENADHYEQLATQLKSTQVDLLYVTDREPEHDEEGKLHYGVGRSQSLAFGSIVVELDETRSWKELVAWTRSEEPGNPAPNPEVVSVTELGRFPDTPFPVVLDDFGQVVTSPETEDKHARARDSAMGELSRRLVLTERNAVWVSVHGVQTEFEEGAEIIAMTWHQRGRWGVPIYYSWPAGQSGFISGYSYDRESGEFTIFHLKQLLRGLAGVPEIESINLFAHSRGADVLLSAIRELIIEARAAGHDPRTLFNFGHLVLVAPDMDMEVATQRIVAEGVGRGMKHVTLYVSDQDWAIGLAQSLFSSKRRVGQMNPDDLTEMQKRLFRKVGNVDLIFYRGSAGGSFGHSYYETPEVLSDIFLLGEGRSAGAEHGRPLEPVGPHLWVIRDGYAP